MRLTTKGRFAVAAMIGLALHQEQGPVTLVSISQRQKISLSYLEQLFGKLRRYEIVESVRGPNSGYSPMCRADGVTATDIAIVVDEPLGATQCGGKGNCGGEEHVGDHAGHYMAYNLWTALSQKMVKYLDSVSLQNLANQQRERQPEVIQGMREACSVRHGRTPTHARAVGTPIITSVAAESIKRTPLINSVFSLAQS